MTREFGARKRLTQLGDLRAAAWRAVVNWPIDVASKAMLPRYTANTVTRQRAYLETGTYRHNVDGIIAADR